MRIQDPDDPQSWVPNVTAVVVISGFLLFCFILAVAATFDSQWDRHAEVLHVLTPITSTAVGWVFGREVHRKAAASNSRDAANGRELAGVIRGNDQAPQTLLDEAQRLFPSVASTAKD